MMKRFLLLLALSASCFATDIYFDLASHGSNNGTSCANARAYSSHVIGDDADSNTLHVCGTGTGGAGATAVLQTLRSCSVGAPCTIKFETGAVLQAQSWDGTTGAIYLQHPYWIVDGGTNGIIQNTLNGSNNSTGQGGTGATCPGGACTLGNASRGVGSTAAATNAIVKNLTVRNLFVRAASLAHLDCGGGADTTGITLFGNNSRITGNTVTMTVNGFGLLNNAANSAHLEIDHNTMSQINHVIGGGVTGTSVNMDDVNIHDNDFAGDAAMWDETAANACGSTVPEYHRNGIILIADSSSCTSNCSITHVSIYNNKFSGAWSTVGSPGQMNGHIFMDDAGSNTITAAIFNNIFDSDAADAGFACGYICQSQNTTDTGNVISNNTFAPHKLNNGTCSRLDNQINLAFKNNLLKQCGYDFNNHGSTFTTPSIDYNFWYDPSIQTWLWPPSCGSGCSFSAWQAAGFDTHGHNGTNPNLNSDFTLPTGSAAIGAGTNLTNLCSTFPALCTGAPQTFGVGGTCGTGCLARSPSAAWDAGAYPFTSSSQASTPTFSPVAGSYVGTQSVTISSTTAGATVCYTTDSSTPTANGSGTCTHGTTYSVPVSVATSETVKAIASKSGFADSPVGSAAYVITVMGNRKLGGGHRIGGGHYIGPSSGTPIAATPTFSPVAGTYTNAQSVTISTTTSGATICWTFDGSTPSADGAGTCVNGLTYSAPVNVTYTQTLKAIASKSGYLDSVVGSAAYVIVTSPPTTPTFFPNAGTYSSPQSVTISSSVGATICYTIDGSTPTANAGACTHGTTYSTPVLVSVSETLEAIASKSGLANSAIGTAAYVITVTAGAPTFSPVAGTYATSQNVTISTTSGGAIICYNTTGSPHTNGTTGCTAGTLYSTPVTVSVSETLFAVAGGTGFTDSAASSAMYTIGVGGGAPLTYTARTDTCEDGTQGSGPCPYGASDAHTGQQGAKLSYLGRQYNLVSFTTDSGGVPTFTTTSTNTFVQGQTVSFQWATESWLNALSLVVSQIIDPTHFKTAAVTGHNSYSSGAEPVPPYPQAIITDTLPSLGGLSGAGNCITDPDFGTRICRITDYTHFNSAGLSFSLGSDGIGHRLSADSPPSLLLAQATSGAQCLITLNYAGFGNGPDTPSVTSAMSALCGNADFPGNSYTLSTVDPHIMWELVNDGYDWTTTNSWANPSVKCTPPDAPANGSITPYLGITCEYVVQLNKLTLGCVGASDFPYCTGGSLAITTRQKIQNFNCEGAGCPTTSQGENMVGGFNTGTSSHNALPFNWNGSWNGVLLVDDTDTSMTVSFSDGGQASKWAAIGGIAAHGSSKGNALGATKLTNWTQGKGSRVLDTHYMTITGDWGTTGAVLNGQPNVITQIANQPLSETLTLHGGEQTPNSNYAIWGSGVNPSCASDPRTPATVTGWKFSISGGLVHVITDTTNTLVAGEQVDFTGATGSSYTWINSGYYTIGTRTDSTHFILQSVQNHTSDLAQSADFPSGTVKAATSPACACAQNGLPFLCNAYYWHIADNVVNPCGTGDQTSPCQGHHALGMNDYRGKYYTANSFGQPSTFDGVQAIPHQDANNVACPNDNCKLFPQPFPGLNAGTYQNHGPTDQTPVALVVQTPCGIQGNENNLPCDPQFTDSNYNEFVASENFVFNSDAKHCSGPCVYRFAHTGNAGDSWNFNVSEAITPISKDGTVAVIPTDWGHTLGCTDGTPGPCLSGLQATAPANETVTSWSTNSGGLLTVVTNAASLFVIGNRFTMTGTGYPSWLSTPTWVVTGVSGTNFTAAGGTASQSGGAGTAKGVECSSFYNTQPCQRADLVLVMLTTAHQ